MSVSVSREGETVSTATLIGLLAGFLTTTAWLPQVVRAFRTHSTRDFSWSWFAMFGTGVGVWLVYGFAVGAPAVIITNALNTKAAQIQGCINTAGTDTGCSGSN